MQTAYLGIDIGGTASRWALVDTGGANLARGATTGATGHIFNPAERDKLRATFAKIAGALPAGIALASVEIGVTGYGASVHADMMRLLHELLPSANINIRNDMELAYLAAFAPGAGHMISAGTGSIGIHMHADGAITRVGGRGILIDDGGSGTWIALNALDRLYRNIDESGTPGNGAILAEHLFAAIGGDDWDATRAYVYGSDRGKIGALAQHVAAAASAGDELAQHILQDAAHELARLAIDLIGRCGDKPVAFVGGVTNLTPLMKPALVAALPGHEVTFPQIDAALAAAQRAQLAAN